MRVLVGVDAGSRDHAGAEHVLHDVEGLLAQSLDGAELLVSTHVVTSVGAHVALALSWEADAAPDVRHLARRLAAGADHGVVVGSEDSHAEAGDAGLLAGARTAVTEHRSRRTGRLVRFEGQADVVGSPTAADVVRMTCVDEVVGLSGTEVAPSTVLELGDFVRPTWREGRCVLLVQTGPQGPVPFEAREQIACCADH